MDGLQEVSQVSRPIREQCPTFISQSLVKDWCCWRLVRRQTARWLRCCFEGTEEPRMAGGGSADASDLASLEAFYQCKSSGDVSCFGFYAAKRCDSSCWSSCLGGSMASHLASHSFTGHLSSGCLRLSPDPLGFHSLVYFLVAVHQATGNWYLTIHLGLMDCNYLVLPKSWASFKQPNV